LIIKYKKGRIYEINYSEILIRLFYDLIVKLEEEGLYEARIIGFVSVFKSGLDIDRRQNERRQYEFGRDHFLQSFE
jgi:hypothetical protein